LVLLPAVMPRRVKAMMWKRKYCMKRKRKDAHRLPSSLLRWRSSSAASPAVWCEHCQIKISRTRCKANNGVRQRTWGAVFIWLAGEREAVELIPCQYLKAVLERREVLGPVHTAQSHKSGTVGRRERGLKTTRCTI
jgi:hypothetical protein